MCAPKSVAISDGFGFVLLWRDIVLNMRVPMTPIDTMRQQTPTKNQSGMSLGRMIPMERVPKKMTRVHMVRNLNASCDILCNLET